MMKQAITNDWPAYHVFLAKLDGQSYRCSSTLNDTAFDRLMDALCWKMPYNLRAFHTSDPSGWHYLQSDRQAGGRSDHAPGSQRLY